MKRRDFITTSIMATASFVNASKSFSVEPMQALKGNINHSVARWCFNSFSLEELLPRLKDFGIHAIDLINPEDWPILKKHGMHCSMCSGAAINLTDGFCDPQFHAQLIKNYREIIPQVADAGFTNLICFSGNRRGINDIVGIQNCVDGLEQILPLAEKHNVVIQMELFNQQDHPDYMCDSSLWGVELCRRLGSDHFKLLFDIYHMQIQEGDIIHSIKKYHQYFGHYHTAGVPGRHEIDETQELFYPAIMKAIVETGFEGYVAQEFMPTWENPFKSLRDAIKRCDV